MASKCQLNKNLMVRNNKKWLMGINPIGLNKGDMRNDNP